MLFKLMANIEKRRKQRAVIPIAIIAGAVILTGGIITALVLLISHTKHDKPAPVPTESVLTDPPVTPAPTEAPTPVPTEPAPSPIVTSSPTQDAIKTEEAVSTEPGGQDPVRISEDLSEANIEIVIRNGRVKLKCLIDYVNNTDSVLYYGGFYTGGLDPVTASCEGLSSRFFVDENGMMVIPFLSELEQGETFSLYFELEGKFDPESGMTLPVFGYDTAYLVSAAIESDVPLHSEGAVLKLVSTDGSYRYAISKKSVHIVTLK